MSSSDEVAALIKLLNDNDPEVLKVVTKRLLGSGEGVISKLETAWEKSLNEVFQSRVENLVHQIQFNSLHKALLTWTHTDNNKLLDGVYLIAKYAFPELKIKDISDKLDLIIKDAIASVPDNGTDLERVKALNHLLFDVHGFAQNSSNFYAPQNSFLNIVLEQHQGNPISLSVVYMLVAQAIGMPVYGVNLPKNFILVFTSNEWSENNSKGEYQFYINPYNGGAVLSAKEIEFFIKQQKLSYKPEYYEPCSNAAIVRRIFQNLIHAYKQLKQEEKVNDFTYLRKILDEYLVSKGELLD